MQTTFQDMFRDARDAHNKMATWVSQLGPALQGMTDAKELADAAYAFREAETLLDEARKRVTSAKQLAEKLACLVSVTVMDGECIRTAYCTAIPNARVNVKIPSRRKDYDNWVALMTHLGVPPNLLGSRDADGSAVIEPHWIGLMAHLSKEQAEGKPLPPGVDPNKTVTDYSLVIRKKKGVTE